MSQRERREACEHEAEAISCSILDTHNEEKERLLATQANEYQALVEMITKAAALEEVELPAVLTKYRCVTHVWHTCMTHVWHTYGTRMAHVLHMHMHMHMHM